jgi:hypothetical protein
MFCCEIGVSVLAVACVALSCKPAGLGLLWCILEDCLLQGWAVNAAAPAAGSLFVGAAELLLLTCCQWLVALGSVQWEE